LARLRPKERGKRREGGLGRVARILASYCLLCKRTPLTTRSCLHHTWERGKRTSLPEGEKNLLILTSKRRPVVAKGGFAEGENRAGLGRKSCRCVEEGNVP